MEPSSTTSTSASGSSPASSVSTSGSEAASFQAGMKTTRVAQALSAPALARISAIDSSVHEARKPPTTSRTSSSDSAR